MLLLKVMKILAGAAALGYMLLSATVTVSQTLDDVPSFRCDDEIVSVGDRQYKVREACGLPEQITVSDDGAGEEWIYNFGPTDFIYYLKFVNGRLERIQTGGYGFKSK